MLEQVSTSVKFLAFFTASKTGKTGLTVTVDLYDPSGTQIVTGGSATAIGGGLYAYTLSTNNSAEGEYAAIFKTSDSTVDAQHIPSLWVLGRAGVENLDAAVSSRLAPSGTLATVTTLTNAPTVPTAATIASQVRTELGTELGRLDAAVSSRLAPSGTLATVTTLTNAPSVPSASTIASQVRTELTTELARIDAPISGATAPTASTVATAVRTELGTELGRIDAAITTRAATGTLATDVTAIRAKTDALVTDRLAQVSTVATTGAQLAAALS